MAGKNLRHIYFKIVDDFFFIIFLSLSSKNCKFSNSPILYCLYKMDQYIPDNDVKRIQSFYLKEYYELNAIQDVNNNHSNFKNFKYFYIE